MIMKWEKKIIDNNAFCIGENAKGVKYIGYLINGKKIYQYYIKDVSPKWVDKYFL